MLCYMIMMGNILIATMETELERFNIAPLSNENTMEMITSGKNKFSCYIYIEEKKNKILSIQ